MINIEGFSFLLSVFLFHILTRKCEEIDSVSSAGEAIKARSQLEKKKGGQEECFVSLTPLSKQRLT